MHVNRCCRTFLKILLIVVVAALVYNLVVRLHAWRVALSNKNQCAPRGQQYPCVATVDNTLRLDLSNDGETKDTFNVQNARYLTDLLVRLEQNQQPPVDVKVQQELKSSDKSKTVVGTLYIVASQVNTGVLVFRGTEHLDAFIADMALEQTDFTPFRTLTDVLPELNMLLAPLRIWKRHEQVQIKPNSVLSNQSSAVQQQSSIRVHRGFFQHYERIRSTLMSSIHSLGLTRILVAGHSKGGALASLAALDIVLNAPTVQSVEVYTFGSPRVGNQSFVQTLHNAPVLTQFFQVQNNADIVPSMPFAVVPNRGNPENPTYYEHAGTPVVYASNWGSFGNNHALSNYIYALDHQSMKLHFLE